MSDIETPPHTHTIFFLDSDLRMLARKKKKKENRKFLMGESDQLKRKRAPGADTVVLCPRRRHDR